MRPLRRAICWTTGKRTSRASSGERLSVCPSATCLQGQWTYSSEAARPTSSCLWSQPRWCTSRITQLRPTDSRRPIDLLRHSWETQQEVLADHQQDPGLLMWLLQAMTMRTTQPINTSPYRPTSPRSSILQSRRHSFPKRAVQSRDCTAFTGPFRG